MTSVDKVPGAARVRRLRVAVASPDALRATLLGPLGAVASRRVRIDVASWQPPCPGWSARLGPLRGLVRHTLWLSALGRGSAPAPAPTPGPGPALGSGPVAVRVLLAEPLPFRLVATAVLAALAPAGGLPAPASPDVACLGVSPQWLPPQADVTAHLDGPTGQEPIRPYDVLLTGPATGRRPTQSDVDRIGVVKVAAQPWGVAGRVLVDSSRINPTGYSIYNNVDVLMEVSAAGWALRRAVPSRPDAVGLYRDDSAYGGCSGTLDLRPLSERQLSAVRALRSIRIGPVDLRPDDAQGFAALASLVASLSMTGVVVHAVPTYVAPPHVAPPHGAPPDTRLGDTVERSACLPDQITSRLAPELVAIIAEPLPLADAPYAEWEARSIRQRRVALRAHGTAWALPSTVPAWPVEPPVPAVSALVVVACHEPEPRWPEVVRPVVAMMTAQTYPSVDLVVALHGDMAEDMAEPDGRADRLPVDVVRVPARYAVDDAWAAAVARARGSLLSCLDPGVAYPPEHIADLALAYQYSGARMVGRRCDPPGTAAGGATVPASQDAWAPERYQATWPWGPAEAATMLARSDLATLPGWPLRVSGSGPFYLTHAGGIVDARV